MVYRYLKRVAQCFGYLSIMDIMEEININVINDKSRGVDGFIVEFVNLLKEGISPFILRALIYSFDTGCMSSFRRHGAIVLIPKPDKDKIFVANWMGITLLSVFTKSNQSPLQIGEGMFYKVLSI